MSRARSLIKKHGGIRPLARILGHKNHTTVQGWWERDTIPNDHVAEVLALERTPRADAAERVA